MSGFTILSVRPATQLTERSLIAVKRLLFGPGTVGQRPHHALVIQLLAFCLQCNTQRCHRLLTFKLHDVVHELTHMRVFLVIPDMGLLFFKCSGHSPESFSGMKVRFFQALRYFS